MIGTTYRQNKIFFAFAAGAAAAVANAIASQ